MDPSNIDHFFEELDRQLSRPATIILVGGAAALLLGGGAANAGC